MSTEPDLSALQDLGTKYPRLGGLVMIALGLAFGGINLLLLHYRNSFYPALFLFPGALVPSGAWVFLTGRMEIGGEPRQPLWWRVPYFACLFGGMAVAMYLAFTLL